MSTADSKTAFLRASNAASLSDAFSGFFAICGITHVWFSKPY
jgi:hypothetical protein